MKIGSGLFTRASHMRRLRSVALASAMLALLLTGPTLAGTTRDSAPNIVLISLDTVRTDHLSVYGYARETSPALAEFAHSGALFMHAYSQSSSTVPTHASMFTGRYPFQHGTFTMANRVPPAELMLAENLASNGYRTFAVSTSIRFRRGSGFEQGFGAYETLHNLDKNARSGVAVDRILAHARQNNAKPFFAFLHLFDAHLPYAPPAPFLTMWHPGLPSPTPEDSTEYMLDHRAADAQVAEDVLEYLRALYDAGIRYQDEALGRLFDELSEAPNGRSTLWIITSDHGEEFKEHGYMTHARYLHEELLRVPLIMVWPDRISPSTRVVVPAQSVDLFPTILELAELPTVTDLAGRSLASTLRPWPARPPEDERDVIVVQQEPDTWGVIATLPNGRFKLVVQDDAEVPELYKLTTDPRADHDVVSQYPEERETLTTIARAIGVSSPPEHPASERNQVQVPAHVVERLRALGYVDEADEVER